MSLHNQILSEKEAMREALQEAKKACGFVSPDPPVGCVILSREGRFLASGHYAHYGAQHAEISALKKIKDKSLLKGARLFVTLEPCAHFGKTPPCADALLQQPLGCVTYGIEDPNPLTQGKGIEKLKSAGMRIEKTRFLQKPIQRLYEAFALNKKKNLTFFALKTAGSLDGVASLWKGENQWITGSKTKEFTAHLRAFYDAVLIGVGTFLQDRPRLNSRPLAGQKIPPPNKVCILDPKGVSLELIARSPLAKVRPMENIFVITQQQPKKTFPFKILHTPALSSDSNKQPSDALQCSAFPHYALSSSSNKQPVVFGSQKPVSSSNKQSSDELLQKPYSAHTLSSSSKKQSFGETKKQEKDFSFCPSVRSQSVCSQALNFDLKALSRMLYKEGIGSVLVEGGAETFSRWIEQGMAHRLYWFINPCLLGGAQGRYWTEELSLSPLGYRTNLHSTEILTLGEDILLTGVLT